MEITKLFVLNGGDGDYVYIVGNSKVEKINERFNRGNRYFEVALGSGKVVEVYSTNVVVVREVS